MSQFLNYRPLNNSLKKRPIKALFIIKTGSQIRIETKLGLPYATKSKKVTQTTKTGFF